MKFNTAFLFLFLILLITSEIDLDSYSIEPFKEYLKKEGLYVIIESILKAYNQDVAIISCEELTESRKGNCKRLVIEYMKHSDDDDIASTFVQEQNYSKEDYHIKCIKRLNYSEIINPKFIKYTPEIKKELRKNYTIYQSNLIFNKIVKRLRDIGVCEE